MKVQKEAQEKMVEAVKDSGLELSTYNQIAQLAQYDADFRTRIGKNVILSAAKRTTPAFAGVVVSIRY